MKRDSPHVLSINHDHIESMKNKDTPTLTTKNTINLANTTTDSEIPTSSCEGQAKSYCSNTSCLLTDVNDLTKNFKTLILKY